VTIRTRFRMAAAWTAILLLPVAAGAAAPVVGQQCRWTLSFRAELQQAAGRRPAVALAGEWSRTVVAVRPDAFDAQVQLTSVTFEAPAGREVDARELAALQERLAKPFWITTARDGALRAIHFTKEVSPSDRNLLQMIATAAQFVQADGAHAVWTSLEHDGGGAYLAVYQKTGPSRYRKKKVKYTEPGTGQAGSQSFAIAIEHSEAEFAFTPEGVMAEVDGVEQVRLSLPGPQGESLGTRIELHLRGLRALVDQGLAARLAMPASVEHLPITTHQPDPAAAQEQIDRELLAGQTTEAIFSAAERNERGAADRLAAAFRRRPESVPLAATRFTAGPGSQAIASGLARAGTRAATRALAGLAGDASRPPASRVGALVAIAGLRQPEVDAMRIPAPLIDDPNPDVREAARLATGALAHAGRLEHPAESDALEGVLAARFDKAATTDEKTQWLAALGNSAGPRSEHLLTAALRDPHDGVRAAAARSLRLVPGGDVDERLAAALSRDAKASVRGAALFAMGFRSPLSPTLWAAVLRSARDDAIDSVRNRAISLMRDDVSRPPEAEATLEWVAEHDRADAIRRFARETLEAIRSRARTK
jgi:hypothetical protein